MPMQPIRKAVTLTYFLGPGDTLASVPCVLGMQSLGWKVMVRGIACREVFEGFKDVVIDPTCRHGGSIQITWNDPYIVGIEKDQHIRFAFSRYLSEQLKFNVPCIGDTPKLFIKPSEIPKRDKPYFVLSTSIKSDMTVKAYPHWQDVVDLSPDDIEYIQVGAEHDTVRLRGVTDMVGQTNLRELFALCAGSIGGAGHESLCNHVYAALGLPFICIVPGLVNPDFVRYPLGVYLSNYGKTCGSGSCNSPRVVPIKDQNTGANERLCFLPVLTGTVPCGKCMYDIDPTFVADEIISLLLNNM